MALLGPAQKGEEAFHIQCAFVLLFLVCSILNLARPANACACAGFGMAYIEAQNWLCDFLKLDIHM
jgi:hypothetical protein